MWERAGVLILRPVKSHRTRKGPTLMSIARDGRNSLLAGSWEEITGVTPRTGGRGLSMEVACWAADQGFTVVAMLQLAETDGEKKPKEKWRNLGFRSSEEIKSNSSFLTRGGVGILTGPSRLVVIDIDGREGEREWKRLCAGHKVPETMEIKTHNGRHLIFKSRTLSLKDHDSFGIVEFKTQSEEIAPGIDVRARGGLELIYDIGQPERHPTSLARPAVIPHWLSEIIPRAGSRKARSANGSRSRPVRELARNGMPPGKHNNSLYRMAIGSARNNPDWTPDEWLLYAKGALARSGEGIDAKGNRDRPPFTDEEIIKKWEDALEFLAEDDTEFEADALDRARYLRVNERAREINASLAGDEDVFSEVKWDNVKPKNKIPLDEDGVFLTERIHWISGAAGDGKSILAYWKLVQLAKRRAHSAIYECEMGEDLVMGLLRNLGATDGDLKYIHYFKANEDGTVVNLVRHGRAFCAMLIRRGITALLYDALNPLLVASSLNENLAADVRAFVTATCFPIANSSGLVLVIDHTGKVIKGQSRGSSDKPAAGHVDLVLRKTETFGRGISGAMELTCNKDRTGSILDGSRLTIKVEASPDGSLRLKPDMWDWKLSESEPVRLRAGGTTQQKLVEFGRDLPEGFTPRQAAQFLGISEKSVGMSLGRGAKPDKNGKVVFKLVRRGLWAVVSD